MIFTKLSEYEQIKEQLDKEDVITLISCQSCCRAGGSGGEPQMRELALRLRQDGYQVKDGYTIPSVCGIKLQFAKIGKDTDTILSMACHAGTCNIRRYFSQYKIAESIKDIGLMVTDSDKNALKIIIADPECSDEIGKEYEMGTGAKLPSDDNLPEMGAAK